jgi:hypothetical protein
MSLGSLVGSRTAAVGLGGDVFADDVFADDVFADDVFADEAAAADGAPGVVASVLIVNETPEATKSSARTWNYF